MSPGGGQATRAVWAVWGRYFQFPFCMVESTVKKFLLVLKFCDVCPQRQGVCSQWLKCF